jgi:hypothetical protein
MRLRTVTSAHSVRCAVVLLASLVLLALAPAPAGAQDCCNSFPDPNPHDCVAPRCIENHCELNYPLPGGTPCDDGDGNACTLGACVAGAGKCQTATHAPDGTVCPDTDKDPCTFASCHQGECLQGGGSPVPPMDDVASVAVEARPARVSESEAFCDCCIFCEEQSLEALRPTPSGAEFLEPDGGLPFRTKYCGTVVRYGINNELDAPRDIMINILPKTGFEHFVAGFVNTECTELGTTYKKLFAKEDSECPVSLCQAESGNVHGKCIHAEITPSNFFYHSDARWLPITGLGSSACDDGWDCNSSLEPASEWHGGIPPGGQPGQGGRQICVYGVYAYDHGPDHRASDHRQLCCSVDASHDRPEIHPFDALWFLHPGGRPGWIFGVFQDDSNRYSFPHCGSQNNGNTWSQGPRDLTFRFPFRFPRSQTPLKACLRHTMTTTLAGVDHEDAPINVTTKLMADPLVEIKALKDGNMTLLEAVEPAGAEDETQVRIEGCVTPTEISGFVVLRVAVGCPRGASCPGLADPDDPGSGFYYAELTFERDCGGLSGIKGATAKPASTPFGRTRLGPTPTTPGRGGAPRRVPSR